MSPLSLSLEANSSIAVKCEKRTGLSVRWHVAYSLLPVLSLVLPVACRRAQRGGLVTGYTTPQHSLHADHSQRQRHRRGADGQQAQRQRSPRTLDENNFKMFAVFCAFAFTLCQRKSWRFHYLALNFINLESGFFPPHSLYKPQKSDSWLCIS